MRKIEADDQSLSSYLMIKSDIGILNIPFSQRPYEWEKAQVVRLFNDLVSLRDNSDEIHMLNFFTLSREGDTTKVFDGQQRTVTSLLIVSSFARVLRELGKKEVSDYLIETYLIDKNPLKNTEDHKLIFENEDTNLLFYELIGSDDYKSKQSKNYSDITQKHLVSNNLLTTPLRKTY
ncbi:DUF262 domain-containing protein [Lactococcus petauri]|uniref:DUF262 domain-containing protein n=1 Tax=Lactococcus petauri TaxID=1940789 RepID=UPI002551538C|nr:DUF262 domain-containing protein [Lactococcus petauri]